MYVCSCMHTYVRTVRMYCCMYVCTIYCIESVLVLATQPVRDCSACVCALYNTCMCIIQYTNILLYIGTWYCIPNSSCSSFCHVLGEANVQ